MKVERDGEVIRYQDDQENIAGVIAPLVAVQIIDKEMLDHYWEYCTGIIKPGGHSIQDAIKWLEGNWDLEPLSLDDRQMTVQRANIAANKFPDRYGTPDISQEMEDEEVEQRIREGHIRQKTVEETTDEQLGIRLRGYHIPYTVCNQSLYDEGYVEFEKRMPKHRRWMQKNHPGHSTPPLPSADREKRKTNAYLLIEETQAHIFDSGIGAEPLRRRLGKYIGISKEDIETRPHRFMGYVHCMAEEGELPTLQEFCATNSPGKRISMIWVLSIIPAFSKTTR